MKYNEAMEAAKEGKISGFSSGERVYAKRNARVVCDEDGEELWCPKGWHCVAKRFSRGRYWFLLVDKWFHGRKSDFETPSNSKVVLEVFA